MLVTDYEIEHATSEQLMLVGQIYVLMAKKAIDISGLTSYVTDLMKEPCGPNQSGFTEFNEFINDASEGTVHDSVSRKESLGLKLGFDMRKNIHLKSDEILKSDIQQWYKEQQIKKMEALLKDPLKFNKQLEDLKRTKFVSGRVRVSKYNKVVRGQSRTPNRFERRVDGKIGLKNKPTGIVKSSQKSQKMIDKIEIPKTEDLSMKIWNDAKQQAAISAGISAVLNIGDLINGNVGTYVGNVGLSAGQAVATSTLTNVGQQVIGDWSGPVASVVVGSIMPVYSVGGDGDIEKFMRSMGTTIVSTGTAIAGAKGGAIIGGCVGGPIGAAVGGVVGGIIGSIFGKKVSKGVGISKMSKQQKIEIKKAMEEHKHKVISESMEKVKQELATKGQVLEARTPEEFESQIKSGQIKIKILGMEDLAQGHAASSAAVSSQKFMRESVRYIFILAKSYSPTGNITDGLKRLKTSLQ
ncbi:MAG: hypothetical protein A2X09_14185 [Bacteroidetes bacterium GWF2_43_11]|nr:MAG: hypothetical protein A2X09_14185 [Bacteroidetes bacterium GWF2_43_11]